MTDSKEINILLVEDTEEHALLIQRGLEDGAIAHKLFLARDGEGALDFLHNKASFAAKRKYPKPDVILLDLRLPKLSGIEVLERIRADEKLKDIPVVILTVSDQRDDILRSVKVGAQSYVLKSTAIAPKTGEVRSILDAVISLVS